MKRFALAGNPNCGKTTLFNSLTGSTAHVGNWPGVTVDKREGVYKKIKEDKIDIVDLPGIYSLSPYTNEEVISRNYILEEKPDCVINVVDATNLERNLYLTTQLLEINVPVIIALNMMDLVERNGEKIDVKKLEEILKVPVVEVSALRETNLKELMERAYECSKEPRQGYTVLEDSNLIHLIHDTEIAFKGIEVDNPLFHAIKLVENDEIEAKNHPQLVKIVDEFKATFNDDTFGNDLEAIVCDGRYKYITKHFSNVKSIVKHEETCECEECKEPKKKGFFHRKKKANVTVDENGVKHTLSDRIDRVLTNKWAGIPIFLVILFLIFHFTFSEDLFFLGAMGAFEGVEPCYAGTAFEGLFYSDGGLVSIGVILHNLLDIGLSSIMDATAGGLEAIGAQAWVSGFLVDGVMAGLFAVIGFLPEILTLFLFFSILEDTGYMARVAFILDRIFRKFGLSGRSFMPMIMGFGCSVPAFINTRTLADEKERVATIRVIPFFSCGAKLPILTAIAGGLAAEFGMANVDLFTFSMYLFGMAVALIAVIVMRNTTMRGKVPPFIMELPAYHWPQFKSLMLHLWDKLKHYVVKACTIILFSTIIIWVLSNFSTDWQYLAGETMERSILAEIGKIFTPLFTPLGFGSQLVVEGQPNFSWVFVVAAVTGLIAKENVIATFGLLAASIVAGWEATEEGVEEIGILVSATGITIPALVSFIMFNMTTIPCFAAVATAKAELPKGTLKWTVLFWMGTSYLVSMFVYLVGTWWWTVFIFLAVFIACGVGIYFYNKKHPVLGYRRD